MNPVTGPAPTSPQSAGHPPDEKAPRPRVLVVEDYEPNRLVVDFFLRQLGAIPFLAKDAEQALELLSWQSCDVVLLDLMLPGINGWEAAGEIRQLMQSTGRPVPALVAMTSHSALDEFQKVQACGISGFLEKPFSVEQLFDMLIQVLGAEATVQLCPPFDGTLENLEGRWDEPIFDHVALFEMLRRSTDALRIFVKGFWEHSVNEITRARKALEAGDAQTLRTISHNWSGACGYLKALPLQRALRVLGTAIRTSDFEKMREIWPLVETQMLLLLGGLKVYLRVQQPTGEPSN